MNQFNDPSNQMSQANSIPMAMGLPQQNIPGNMIPDPASMQTSRKRKDKKKKLMI